MMSGCRYRTFLRPAPLLALLFLAGCLAGQPPEVSRNSTVSAGAVRSFETLGTSSFTRSNASARQDILDLVFSLEGGQRLPVLTRYETPVRIGLSGGALGPVSQRDLDQLIAALRSRSGIDIALASSGETVNLVVALVPPAEMQRLVPNAACFVAPRVSSWTDYKSARRSNRLDWSTLTRRDMMSVFIPKNAAPQDIRDCLHEEIAQALGPTNDLYSLADSVFNDDDYHRILTGFDYLVLRTIYDRRLKSGMSREEVAGRLGAILDDINPSGRFGGVSADAATPNAWRRDIATALGRGTPDNQRISAIERAVLQAQRWGDNRLGFALHSKGRLLISKDGRVAAEAFMKAAEIFSGSSLTRLHWANVSLQLVSFHLSTNDTSRSLGLIEQALPIALAAQDAQLVARLLMFKARALEIKGNQAEADAIRLDSLAWARYGLGDTGAFRREMQQVASIGGKGSRG